MKAAPVLWYTWGDRRSRRSGLQTFRTGASARCSDGEGIADTRICPLRLEGRRSGVGAIIEMKAMIGQYGSEGLATVREVALGPTDAGLTPKRTMRTFDELCLTPVEEMAPEDIRALRLRENASQAVFARHLNVTTGRVSQWERGEKRSRGGRVRTRTIGGSALKCRAAPGFEPTPAVAS